MNISNNNLKIQKILEIVNNLPEAGFGDTDTSTTDFQRIFDLINVLSEKDTTG